MFGRSRNRGLGLRLVQQLGDYKLNRLDFAVPLLIAGSIYLIVIQLVGRL